MDWYLDGTDPAAVTWLRREFSDYLRRHATADSPVDDAVLTFAELLNNACEHATGPVWVSVDWTSRQPTLTVHDLGPSFEPAGVAMPDPSAHRGRGLAIAADLAVQFDVEAKAGGGSRATAVLPVEREVETSYDPPRRTRGVLPDLADAGEDGFGREPFLLALVVQLAQEVERAQGPGAAQHAVAQVGMDVGAQMEKEFRLARGIVERLDPEQAAECYVRLKHAIDGDFYVLEANDERIVLGNHRCPFGEIVTHAPALCRMTSSVFGGIAARNFGEASVVLEQRIAVGDPQCVVVVDLQPGPDSPGHRYSGSVED